MKHKIMTVMMAILLVIGISIMSYPAVSNYYNDKNQSRVIEGIDKTTASLPDEEKERSLEEAHEYNRRLRSHYTESNEPLPKYNDVLNIDSSGLMGYLTIEKIDVKCSIKHGTDKETLQQNIGHLEGTSLPVGGDGTHAVLSGHRGLPSFKLFTNLDELVIGDQFIVSVLGDKLYYEVDSITTVLPNEIENITIEEGRDYITLVTCAPYMVNTHRLLVRGERIEAPVSDNSRVIVGSQQVVSPTLLGIGIALIIIVVTQGTRLLLKKHNRKPNGSE